MEAGRMEMRAGILRANAVYRACVSALFVFTLLGWPGWSCARDYYAMDHNFSSPYDRDRYTLTLLKAALDLSISKYGPYELHASRLGMERDRLLQEMHKGQLVNLSAQVTSAEWEQKLIPIRIPIDKGLSGYRIGLIDGRRQEQFSAVKRLDQLLPIAVGAGRQWSSTAVLVHAGFNVVKGNSTRGLHSMLAANRFQYFLRGIDEALFEQATYASIHPELSVERDLVIYFPLPRYFFIAPGQDRLAHRLQYGLQALIANGRFDEIFHAHFDDLIKKAGLRHRLLFNLDNPFLPPQTPLANKAYWYDPFDQLGR